MTLHHFTCSDPHGSHTLAYTDWGDPHSSRVLICLHGLTRNCRDFDEFAAAMVQEQYRVLCIDVAGRGQSDWLRAAEDYGYATYVADTLAMLDFLQIHTIDWVGTSMGGLIGMFIASMPTSPIRRLVMNDIGPLLPQAGLQRIARYVSQPRPRFATLAEAETYFRLVHAQFGALTEAQWQRITFHSVREVEGEAGNRGYELRYDPNITLPFLADNLGDVSLWPIWEKVRCPVLVLHGEQSDLLSEEIIQEMKATHSQTDSVIFSGVGHAPALMDERQIRVVKEWLLKF